MISIVIAGIRTHNWVNIIQSIPKATNESFEVIFVGPYNLPKELDNLANIHYYKDYGSPNRCQQIGCCLSSGKYIMWLADDGIFESNTLQHIINILESTNNKKTIVVTKYTEGERINPGMMKDSYYYMGNCFPKSPYIPHNWWIFNVAILHRNYFEYLGGFDCRFNVTCIPHGDLAARSQLDNANVIMLSESIAHVTHMPNLSGDHAPMHYAQIEDTKLFQNIYSDSTCLNRIRIPLDNWKAAPLVWNMRFKC